MTIKIFSVIIKRYMSNLKIVILRPWTEQFVISCFQVSQFMERDSITNRFALRVQSGSVGSGLACCMAGPSSNPRSVPPGRFFPLSETSNEEIGDMNECAV
jgi:hypothetical protein